MGRIGEDYDKFITRVAAFAHAPFGNVAHDVDGLRSRLVSQMRQQIAVGNVIGNHTMIEAWWANSWVPPGGEVASDAVSDAEPSPQGSARRPARVGLAAAARRSRAPVLMTLRGYLFHALIGSRLHALRAERSPPYYGVQ